MELNDSFDPPSIGNYTGGAAAWWQVGNLGASTTFYTNVMYKFELRRLGVAQSSSNPQGVGTYQPQLLISYYSGTTLIGSRNIFGNFGNLNEQIHVSGEPNHMMMGFDLATDTVEFCLNGYACQLNQGSTTGTQIPYQNITLTDLDNFQILSSSNFSSSVIAFGSVPT